MTSCQIGRSQSLGIQPDAPWQDVLDALISKSNENRAISSQVTRSSFEAARGNVPPEVLMEYIRQRTTHVDGQATWSLCARWGVGLDAVGGVALVRLEAAYEMDADPTDPWSTMLMLLLHLRRIAATRLAAYGDMWSSALVPNRPSSTIADAVRGFEPWYQTNPAWQMTADARSAGFNAVVQVPSWKYYVLPDHLIAHEGHHPPDWPDILMTDYDFWGMVLVEMEVGSTIASKLWRGLLADGNKDLVGYYSAAPPALASLLHDGIVWTAPLLSAALALVSTYPSLPGGLRTAMNLTGAELQQLDDAVTMAGKTLSRIPAYGRLTTVGPFSSGDEDRLSWGQERMVDWATVHNDTAVPVENLYGTIVPFDASVRRWAGMVGASPLPPPEPSPDTPDPSPTPFPPVGNTGSFPTPRKASIIPVLIGAAVPILAFFGLSAWRTRSHSRKEITT